MVFRSVYRLIGVNNLFNCNQIFHLKDTKGFIKYYSVQISSQKQKWDLMAAVSLERKPVIARQLHEIEESMKNFLLKFELERSRKSNHEIQLITDKIKLEQLKKGDSKIDLDSIPEKSAQDFEDASLKELTSFSFADIKTKADKENNIKSTGRHLDRNLVLLVKEKIGGTSTWVLPQGNRHEGETLRQTAERVLQEKCGPEIKVDFFGNAPVGFYKYKYPKIVREKSDSAVGAKIFFYKAQFKEGTVKLNPQLSDYQWATRKELNVLPSEYCKSVTMFLIDEEH